MLILCIRSDPEAFRADRREERKTVVLYYLAFFLFGLDRTFRQRIEETDPADYPKEVEGSRGLLWLYHNQNDGFPFRVLADHQKLVQLLPGGMLLGLAVSLLCPDKSTKESLPAEGKQKTAFCRYLVFLGGLSNFLDRLHYGYVIDYICLRIGYLKKIVWNIGDLMIFLGTAGILSREIFEKRS